MQTGSVSIVSFMYFSSGKSVRIFLSGDYEFLCRMYGLSGAAGNKSILAIESCLHVHIHVHVLVGRHCCLWCEISTENLKVLLNRRGLSQLRSLESLDRDYERFMQAEGNIKTAKLYNNVIHEYVWGIPISQV